MNVGSPIATTQRKPIVTKPSSTRTVPAVTTFSPCLHNVKNTILELTFLRYNNPNNLKASGLPCDGDGSPCDITLEICVSHINSRCVRLYISL